MKLEELVEYVQECEKLREQVKDRNTKAYLDLLDSMRKSYEEIKKIDKRKSVSNLEESVMDVCEEMEIILASDKVDFPEKIEMLLGSYDTRARFGDFRAYCIALEWNRPLEKQFFLPRRRIFEKHGFIQAMQDMADDKLDFLFISMPPRVGKSTLGLFFITFMAGLFPDRSILANGHTAPLMQSFYSETLNVFTSEEYRFGQIFPSNKIVKQNAEYTWIDMNREKRFHTINYRAINSGTTGLVEASNLLYCDDLIKDVEEANNPDRLDKLFYTYTGTVQDRKISKLCKDGEYRPCPEIHIATRWSLNDVIGRLLAIYGDIDLDRIRIINIPCYDEKGESNFMYDYGKGFDKEYYHHLQLAEDPVIFTAKYLGEPIEREGRPFTKDMLCFYNELPEGEPDRIVAYGDVSHGGEDYFSMPIAFVYDTEVYIEDVFFEHKFGGDDYSRPKICELIMRYGVKRIGFESANGGDFFATLIEQDLRRMNYRCSITTHKVPTTKSKLDRILGCQNEIKGIAVEENTYRLYFKNTKTIEKNHQYREALQQLFTWSQSIKAQKTQHDDFPDSLAGLITNLLSGKTGRAKSYNANNYL